MTDVVAALIREKDKFLICQRPKDKNRAFLWEFVGGKTEKGESKENALIRECKEELGIEVMPLDIYFEVDHVYPDMTIHLTVYNARIVKGVPKRLEHQDFKWITAEEIQNYQFCPADKSVLEKIIYDSKKSN